LTVKIAFLSEYISLLRALYYVVFLFNPVTGL